MGILAGPGYSEHWGERRWALPLSSRQGFAAGARLPQKTGESSYGRTTPFAYY